MEVVEEKEREARQLRLCYVEQLQNRVAGESGSSSAGSAGEMASLQSPWLLCGTNICYGNSCKQTLSTTCS